MMHLIQLEDGEVLTTVSKPDATLLDTHLVRGFDKTPEWLVRAETVDLLLEHGLSKALAMFLRQRIAESAGPHLEVGFEWVVEEFTHTLSGCLQDSEGTPIGGALVQGFDEDLFDDDFLGWTFSRPDGTFRLHFHELDFTERIAGINIEGNPEVYLRIRRTVDADWRKFGPQDQVTATADWGTLSI